MRRTLGSESILNNKGRLSYTLCCTMDSDSREEMIMAKNKIKKKIKFFESFKGTVIEKGMEDEAKRLKRIYDKKVKKSKS